MTRRWTTARSLLAGLMVGAVVSGWSAMVARATELDGILGSLVEMYRHLVMDTPEDQALHAQVIERSDQALSLLRAALDLPTTDAPYAMPGLGETP